MPTLESSRDGSAYLRSAAWIGTGYCVSEKSGEAVALWSADEYCHANIVHQVIVCVVGVVCGRKETGNGSNKRRAVEVKSGVQFWMC
eukprot:15306785-Ditylum_brightwellii.AAC.1